MKRLYRIKSRYCVLLLLTGGLGCHQDLVIPQSAIPATCRVEEVVTINEGVRDTTAYIYDAFGLVAKSSYRRWSSGQLTTRTDQTFTYTADHYLFSQVDLTTTRTINGSITQVNKGFVYTYQDGLVQQIAIIDNTTNAKLGFKNYTYTGANLITYSESDGNKTVIKRYTFDGNRKLMSYEEPNSGIVYTIANGKITQRVLPDGTTVKYTYDAEGQLIQQNSTSVSSRSQFAYTYDNKPYWTKTQLLLRGIPSPDLGEHTQVHNLLTSNSQQYQNDKLTGTQKLTYSYSYNMVGYSQGYVRSDGVRQLLYYSNCP